MHRTESVDYGVVMEGELTLVLDEGEVQLRPGSVVVQRGTTDHQRRHHRYFCVQQLEGKLMFFQNLRRRPALWPIEFDDITFAIVSFKLVHPVFVTV